MSYEPLPSSDYIRILELFPGSETEPLCGQLLLVRREEDHETPSYDAISYAWGDPNDTVEIICDSKPVQITNNLADALRVFRDPGNKKLLWVDALCIDQNNDLEKGDQVKRMGSVYSNAKCVLVFIGKDEDCMAEDCFSLVQETNRFYGRWCGETGILPNIPSPDDPAFTVCKDRKRWESVKVLRLSPWFTRLWVIQEVALGSKCRLFWGRNSINLAEICELALWIVIVADLRELVGFRMGFVANSFHICCSYRNRQGWKVSLPLIRVFTHQEQRENDLFLTMLDAGRDLYTSKDVDRVYGFLGSPLALDSTGNRLLIKPDYRKSMEDVYFEIACALLAHPREARFVLVFVDHHRTWPYENHYTFPSWVPRWDLGTGHCPVGGCDSGYCAGIADESEFHAWTQSDRSLRLPCILVDHLVWTSEVIERHHMSLDPNEWDEEIGASGRARPPYDQLCDQVVEACSSHEFSSSNLPEIFGITMMHQYNWCNSDRVGATNDQILRAYLQYARRKANSGDIMADPPIDTSLAYLGTTILGRNYNRRVAITSSGYLALVPLFSQPGDVCAVVPGMGAPLTFRPRTEGTYNMVGDCYVHGIMLGEAMEELKEGKRILEEITVV
ncbi:HET-domain-containing protein [Eremomyces bilateralis CBS 781.70]|uniref:HET-domain-containing protein n=1 Tax=Eremomyces bilateralis CBS 781.70 TaxID=1392243 RepID=A0A6G1FYF5_9PEZI|nr:HET-domain-containing protein [Eremomyces bilateralis CBS 781.70]KAF1810877.1 HET-domain-containing protein [Eremomyces bilateralis CBS 781.70]